MYRSQIHKNVMSGLALVELETCASSDSLFLIPVRSHTTDLVTGFCHRMGEVFNRLHNDGVIAIWLGTERVLEGTDGAKHCILQLEVINQCTLAFSIPTKSPRSALAKPILAPTGSSVNISFSGSLWLRRQPKKTFIQFVPLQYSTFEFTGKGVRNDTSYLEVCIVARALPAEQACAEPPTRKGKVCAFLFSRLSILQSK